MPANTDQKELTLHSIEEINPKLSSAIRRTLKTTGEHYIILKEKLQQLYGYITLPKVAWLDGGHDLPMAEYFVKLQLDQSNETIEMNEIFNSVNSKRPLRILIEGQPGFGKTTLAAKITHDWAKNKEYVKHFKLVFLMPLRELRGQTINDAITQIGSQCDFQHNDDIIQIVNGNKEDTLFILDGLDEVLVEERQEIMKILFKQIYSKATILVFCRTGLFEAGNKERKQLFGLSNVCQDFSDKRISILGIKSLEDKKEFLKKFIPELTVQSVTNNLSLHLELFDSPLFLMLLPVVFEDYEHVEQYSTKTEFYQKLFNCLLKHSYAKREMEIANDFDLFRFNSQPSRIQEQIRDFGILSTQKILQTELKFESNDLTKNIYKLGFLINHKETKCFISRNHYEALHLTIVEFAAAFALWTDLKFNECSSTEKRLNATVNFFLDNNGTSLVLPFLAGLMRDNLDNLLSQFHSSSAWFSLDFELSVKLVSECSTTNISNSKNLRNFIPAQVHHPDCNGYITTGRECLKYGSECGRIKEVIINENTSSELFTDESAMGCLQMELVPESDSNSRLRIYITAFSTISYDASRMFLHPVPFKETLEKCLQFAALPTINSCDLEISNSQSAEHFLKLITKYKKFSNIKYQNLKIKITSEFEKKIIINLLKNEQIQSLDLTGNLELDMSDVSRAAAKSKYLTSLCVADVSIDLYDLTNAGTKKYLYFCPVNCTLTRRQPTSLRNCFKYLDVDCLTVIETLTEMESLDLDCCTFKMSDFYKCLQMSETFANLDSTLKNLHTLELYIEMEKKKYEDEEMVAEAIHHLPIVELIIENPGVVFKNLFKHMNNLRADRTKSRLTNQISFKNNQFGSTFLENVSRFVGITKRTRVQPLG